MPDALLLSNGFPFIAKPLGACAQGFCLNNHVSARSVDTRPSIMAIKIFSDLYYTSTTISPPLLSLSRNRSICQLFRPWTSGPAQEIIQEYFFCFLKCVHKIDDNTHTPPPAAPDGQLPGCQVGHAKGWPARVCYGTKKSISQIP